MSRKVFTPSFHSTYTIYLGSLPLLLKLDHMRHPLIFCIVALVATSAIASSEAPQSPSAELAPVIELTTEANLESTSLAVPEPSRLVLLVLGLACISATYRRAWLNYRRS